MELQISPVLRQEILDLTCKRTSLVQCIDYLKNFGFVNETTVVAPGINGKMSEINAAFGMLQLRHVDGAIARWREIDALYRKGLAGVRGLRFGLDMGTHVRAPNHSYFPILVDPEYGLSRDALYDALKAKGIYARRYFYPLITDFPMYRGLPSAQRDNLPAATQAAARVLCLPIYPALTDGDVERVVAILAAHGA